MFALAAPVVMFGVGGAVDYARIVKARDTAQSVADGAALTGARAFSLSNANPQMIEGQVKAYVAAHLASASTQASVEMSSKVVSVSLRNTMTSQFLGMVGVGSTTIAASATARVRSRQIPNCVITLDTFANSSLQIQKGGLLGPNCTLYANSGSPKAIDIKQGAQISAGSICSHGGVNHDAASSLSPTPQTDCPALPDPLADLPSPAYGACTATKMQVQNQTTSLAPGVYCGGLTISGTSVVTLLPGLYVIKDGSLQIKDKASLTGSGITLFLTGNGAVLNVTKDTSLNLAAPAAGPMSGMLIYEDRLNAAGQKHVIQSRNAPNMLGTIYLPQGKLNIGLQYGNGGVGVPVAQSSAWTVVIAQKVAIHDDMQILFNTYYDATAVKPPAGLGEKAPEAVLTN
ncbi:MAG: hypothetical protein KDJ25_13260 [Rhodoblastus sp.]|nr:hypothetical protein [Rhodoblastus sp.]